MPNGINKSILAINKLLTDKRSTAPAKNDNSMGHETIIKYFQQDVYSFITNYNFFVCLGVFYFGQEYDTKIVASTG